MAIPDHVLIVGASLAGIRTAQELRALAFNGRITLVGSESHLPYDRPPLSKQVLAGHRQPEHTQLCSDAKLGELELQLILGTHAVALDQSTKTVTLDSGESVPYDTVVIATGVGPRRLGPLTHGSSAVHVLRTIDDSVALKANLEQATSLAVIGGGFIGAEVAAVARQKGLDVTMIEVAPTPFARALGSLAGAACAALHIDQGVSIRTGVRVGDIVEKNGSVQIRLHDDSRLEADCAVVGIGTIPNVGWLIDTRARVANGVECDHIGRVAGIEDAFAVGDVAAWHDRALGGHSRVEHWTSATEQARIVAHAIAQPNAETPRPGIPYFWSDQYDTKIQLIGHPQLSDDVRLLHEDRDGTPRLFGYFHRRTLVAAAAFGSPRLLARYRTMVATRAEDTDVLELAAAAP